MDNPLAKRFREFISTSSHSRTISALVILIIAAAVPLTVLVAQQRQSTQQHAALTCSGKIGPSCNGSLCEYKTSTLSNSSTLCGAGNTPCCVYEWGGGGSGCPNNCQPVTPTPTAPPPAVTPTPPPGGGGCVPGTGSNPASCGGSISGPMCNGSVCHTQGYYCSGGMCTYGWLGGYATTGCNPVCGTTTSPTPAAGGGTGGATPTPIPSATPVGSISLTVSPYCGIPNTSTNGAPPPASTTGNNGNVSSAYFFWTRPSTTDYTVLTYKAYSPTTGALIYTSDTYLTGTSNSFYAPRQVGSTFPRPDGTNITYPTGCTGTQSGTGFICGFTNGAIVKWQLQECTGTNCNTIKATWNGQFTAATCGISPTPSPTPSGSPTPTPTPATGQAGNLKATASCGSGASANVSFVSFTWSAPSGATSTTKYKIQYQSTNGYVSGTYTVTGTRYDAPAANSQSSTGYNPGFVGGQTVTWSVVAVDGNGVPLGPIANAQFYPTDFCPPPSCDQNATNCGTCTAASNTCNGSGTQTCTYTAYSGYGGQSGNCVQQPTTQNCSNAGPNCQAPTSVCSNGQCVVPTCNGSSQGVGIPDCSGAVCVASVANACGVSTGTESCVYNTYNGNPSCNPVGINQLCNAQCSNPYVCYNGSCQLPATPTPTPTSTPTPTPTPTGTPNPSVTPTPTPAPTPTPTPVPGDTTLALNIGMDAIGSVGDNENPNPSSSNQNPQHPQRPLTVQVFDSNNNMVSNQSATIKYNAASGIFTGTVDLGTNLVSGNYTVKVQSYGHLRRLVPGIQNLGPNLPQPIQLKQVNLVAGDINGDNAINITDYNILLSCINDPNIANIDNHALCNSNPNYATWADLDDNGVVNEFDYNLFLREYSVQNGN